MDGRKAAINVLCGLLIGLSVPIVVTWLLVRTQQFDWAEHSFVIFLCCAVCGAIGAVVNLPWNEAPSRRTMTQIFGEPAAETIDDAAGFEGPGSFAGDPMRDGEAEGTHESPRNRREARAAPRRFSISRREALRLLGLEWQASADDVRQAYRRLARESHPDQFASEGDAAVAAATERFKQIKEAYELLEMEMEAGAETT